MMLKPLLPKKLKESDSSFSTVQELKEVLHVAIDKGEIKNVALTGPFGSGKSSILLTLRDNCTEFEYLPISLATLQAQEGIANNGEKELISEQQEELLNRKIEYSILQQLIYREEASIVPNSRFRRIIYISDVNLRKLAFLGIFFIIAFVVAFEPSWLIVDSIYNILNFGRWNFLLDSIAVIYMLYALFWALVYFIKSYGNSKLNKLNLKDGEIELKEENSIFNKHLDEILYFFQVTKYNVVIIEDLDRFGTSNIFLKLRELNLLINESKIVGRNVVFVYAVKDDVFINEERTKFFDYIATVILVINPSNSKDILIAYLRERGLKDGEIKDSDIADMAFFIQDMRILTNIANEFKQYRDKLCINNHQRLNMKKLLAMMVYKNYYPKDFAELHRRKGKIYECINSKPLFVKHALSTIVQQEKDLEDEYKLYLDKRYITESELRYLYLDAARQSVNDRMTSVRINNQYYSLKDIAKSESLFNEFIICDNITFKFYYHYTNENIVSENIDHKKIENLLNFSKRLTVIKSSEANYKNRKLQLQREKLKIQSFTLSTLITKYKQGDSDIYKNIKLSEMMDVFIRRGFIDEEYYDYISYFYEGMVSLADRDLLLSIKRDIPMDYAYHIDKVENFTKELLPYMFETDAILNNDLFNYLARLKDYHDCFCQVMYRLEKDDAPLSFLAQYYTLGKSVKNVFVHYIEWDRAKSWENISIWDNLDERNILIEGWFKYSGKIELKPLLWLNDNYTFLADHSDGIGMMRCKEISDKCCFNTLNANNKELLDHIIENLLYALNKDNLCLIINELGQEVKANGSNLNLTRIENTANPYLLGNIKDNIKDVLPLFSSTCKDESQSSIRYILNNTVLSEEEKLVYLQNQQNLLDDISDIDNEQFINMAYKLYLIKPTWKNVAEYYALEKADKTIIYAFIEKYSSELGTTLVSVIAEDKIGTIFIDLFSTAVLSVSTFKEVVGSFNRIFTGYEALSALEPNRLTILLDKGKLPFRENNTKVLKQTAIYADYLLHHSAKFYEAKEASYFTTEEVTQKIISSERFSSFQKNELIKIIPDSLLSHSQDIAETALSILIHFDIQAVNEETLKCLLRNASQKEFRIKCLALMIQKYGYGDSQIIELLTMIGGKYEEIAQRAKRPILKSTDWNRVLVSSLEQCGFISSYKEEKEGLRVWPKRIR